MGGWAEGLACADPGARTPIGASENFSFINDQTVKGDGYTKFTPQIPDNVKYIVWLFLFLLIKYEIVSIGQKVYNKRIWFNFDLFCF